MRTTLSVQDPLFVSSPNGGGLLFVHRHLMMSMSQEDATGVASTSDGLSWCMQANGSRALRQVSDGRLSTTSIAETTLDLHDVLATAEGIYVVFTETNQVVRLDAACGVAESWSFGDAPDSAHVNCIAMHQGRLLASMFGRFDHHRGYKGATCQAGIVVDVRSGEILIKGLSQPHSLVSVDGQLWLCSSEDRSLRVYDEHYQFEREVILPGYTRGLAVADEHVYVGISRSRNLAAGEAGEFDTAVIALLDRESLAVQGYVPIPWNEIYDIRIATSASVSNDVMASLWVFEREQQRRLHAQETLLRQGVEKQLVQETALRQGIEQQLAQEMLLRQSAEQELAQEMLLRQSVEQQLAQEMLLRQSVEQQLAQEAQAGQEATRQSAQLQSDLINARGEICKRDARIHVLEQARNELDLIKSSRSWRWTKLMRFVMRVIHHRGLSAEDRRKLMSARPALVEEDAASGAPAGGRSAAPPAVPCLADVELLQASDTRRDFFIWAVIDWHFRIQRPQHLARELAAAGHRVFYISNNFIDRHEPGFGVESLDDEGRLFQIHLHLQDSPAIYHAAPDATAKAQLRAGIGMLLAWTHSRICASLIQHPYWLETAQILPNQRVVYDCMDHHGGFADNTDDVLEREHELMRDADMLVVTSDWLYDEAGKYNPQRMMIRNACQYEHFSNRPEQTFKDAKGRKVIGYYGAIAEWFDLDLLEKVALRFRDCLVLLVGADTCGAQRRLAALDNIEFTGEVPYARLPYYLEGFDVCLLPFQVIPLTLATNPVKVYEYLSAGKEVVSIALPEIRQFGDLVRTGTDHATFLTAVDEALRAVPEPDEIARRRQFAAEQTWEHRVQELVAGIEALSVPRVSVVVVTYNNLDLTKACLRSLELYSDYGNLEVIVVDNASADDTRAWLPTWAAAGRDRHIVLNEDNRGFAAANNQGLAMATGEFLVMLNNDTFVTPGWAATLVAHLRRTPELGMLGPVTNNIGNEARIDISYDTMDDMLRAASSYTTLHAGQLTPLRTAAFFCVMMSRAVYEKVGPLDEAFGIGFFEDDDYCRRVEQAGWSIACAEDVFVHHNLSASFNKLKQDTRQALFEKNKVMYEAKWGAWLPHKYRGR